jgi:hypothetical protein
MGTAVRPRPPAPLRAPLLTAAGGAAFAAALLVRDPHGSGAWGYCPLLLVTGQPCPGCGGLRAVHDLLRGDVAAALSSNAYAVFTAALAAVGYAVWLAAAARGRRAGWVDRLPRFVIWWGVGLLAFGVLRLLPALSVLRP